MSWTARQSWIKELTRLSKTNAFYRRPSIIEKRIIVVDSHISLSAFFNVEIRSVDNVTWLRHWKGRGDRNEKIGNWKMNAFNETGLVQVVCQLHLSMIVVLLTNMLGSHKGNDGRTGKRTNEQTNKRTSIRASEWTNVRTSERANVSFNRLVWRTQEYKNSMNFSFITTAQAKLDILKSS